MALFFDALRWLATVEVEHVIDPDDASTVEVVASAAAFSEHLSSTSWEASPINVRKIGMLLQHEPPGVWQTFGGSSDKWTASLRRGVRKYRNVATLDDYLNIVAEAAPQLYGLGAPWPASPAILPEASAAAKSAPRPPNALTDAEITRVVNRYIGVSGGCLGLPDRFTYRTHADFYAEYCDLSVDLRPFEGTTRETIDLSFAVPGLTLSLAKLFG